MNTQFLRKASVAVASGAMAAMPMFASSVFAAETPTGTITYNGDLGAHCELDITTESKACDGVLAYDKTSKTITLAKSGNTLTLEDFGEVIVKTSAAIEFKNSIDIEAANVTFDNANLKTKDLTVSNNAKVASGTISADFIEPNQLTIAGGTANFKNVNANKITMQGGTLNSQHISSTEIAIEKGIFNVVEDATTLNPSYAAVNAQKLEVFGGSVNIQNNRFGIMSQYVSSKPVIRFSGGETKIKSGLAAVLVYSTSKTKVSDTISFTGNMGVVEKHSFDDKYNKDQLATVLDVAKDNIESFAIYGANEINIKAGGNGTKESEKKEETTGGDTSAKEEDIKKDSSTKNPSTSDHMLTYGLALGAVVLLGFCGKKVLARH